MNFSSSTSQNQNTFHHHNQGGAGAESLPSNNNHDDPLNSIRMSLADLSVGSGQQQHTQFSNLIGGSDSFKWVPSHNNSG